MLFKYCNHRQSLDVCEKLIIVFVFKQKTAYDMRISDWSSDVCSSDLPIASLWLSPCGWHTPWLPVYALFVTPGGGGTASGCAAAEIGRASCRERVCQYV